jgi:hypothetical protein
VRKDLQQELPKGKYCYAAYGKAKMTQSVRNLFGRFLKKVLEEEIAGLFVLRKKKFGNFWKNEMC